MSAVSPLPAIIRTYVGQYVAWQRALALLRATGWGVVLAISWLLGWGLVDRLIHLPGWARLILLCIGAGATVALLWRPVWRAMAGRVRWSEAAEQIEQANPAFGERLATVVSRSLGAAEYQGSPAMLEAVRDELCASIEGQHGKAILRWTGVRRAWIAAILALVVLAAASQNPWLRLGAIMQRLLLPLSPVPPVTTVQLAVTPGHCAIEQDKPMEIKVVAINLSPARTPKVHISRVQGGWTESWMTPAADGRYGHTIPSVDRELRYFISAGDARSDIFTVRLKHRPALRQLRAVFTYPAYMNRPAAGPFVIENIVEAPVKTEVLLTFVASEELKDATVLLGSQRIPTTPTVDPRSRQAKLIIQRDESLRIEMESTQEVKGSGPSGMMIRAIPDRPPVVTLLAPSAELTLAPRQVVPVHAEVTDDVGVARMMLVAQINGGPEQQKSLAMKGDPRRQDVMLELDLAEWPLRIGDIFAFQLRAADGLGQMSAGPVRQVVIGPRSVDFNTHLRIVELKAAMDQATALARAIDAAGTLLEEAAKEEGAGEGINARTKLDQALAAATEDSAALRQRCLRAVVCSGGGDLAVALANWADIAHLSAAGLDVVRRRPAGGALLDRSRKELADVRERVRQLAEQIGTAWKGEQAGAALALKESLDAAKKQGAARAADRLRQELEAAVSELNLKSQIPDLTSQISDLKSPLEALVAGERSMLQGQKPVDFATASTRWAKELGKPVADEPLELLLEGRLELAAVAEAVRSDSDLRRSRDLQIAGAAAARIEAQSADRAATRPAAARRDYPSAMAALQREHELNRRAEGRGVEEVKRVRGAAEIARKKMLEWAGENLMLADGARPTTAPAEKLAMEANAAMADRQYDRARSLDRAMQQDAKSDERAAQMDRLRRLDELADEQAKVARGLEKATPAEAADLAKRQDDLATRMEAMDREMDERGEHDQAAPGSTREDAMAEIAGASQRLAKLDGQITDTERAAASHRQAKQNAEAARQAMSQAPAGGPARAQAQKAMDQANKDLAEARAKEQETAGRTHPDVSDGISSNLKKYAPETTRATGVMDEKLTPAMREMRQAMEKSDAAQMLRAATAARAAAAKTIEELKIAGEELARQEPLGGATQLAEQAAEALQQPTPQTNEARQLAAKAAAAIRSTWQRQASQTAGGRLRDVPGLETLLQMYDDRRMSPAAGAPAWRGDVAGARDWGKLRERRGDVSTGRQDTEPPGYGEALKAYFEALSKEK